MARSMLKGSLIVDLGARTEKIVPSAITIDLHKQYHPDILASAVCLPFREKSIDYLSVLEVIEHLDPPQIDSFLKDSSRTCRALVLSTPNTQSISWRFVWYLWSHTAGRQWHDAHKAFFTPKSLTALLTSYEFKITEMVTSRWHILVSAMSR